MRTLAEQCLKDYKDYLSGIRLQNLRVAVRSTKTRSEATYLYELVSLMRLDHKDKDGYLAQIAKQAWQAIIRFSNDEKTIKKIKQR